MRPAKILGLGIVAAFMVALPVVASFDIRRVFEPKGFLFVINTLFGVLIPFLVAFIAARTYIARRSTAVLLMGCGMLIFGLGMLSGAWQVSVARAPNVGVTVHNISCFLGALFHTAGGLLSLSRDRPRFGASESTVALVSYGAITAFVGLLTWIAAQGLIWPFFISGQGPTVLRQVTLGGAILFYTAGSSLYIARYLTKPSGFVYWYGLCLLLIAMGLCAVFLQKAVGCPLGWLGRSAQYMGCVFALAAIVTAWKEAGARGVPREWVIENFFSDAEAGLRGLVESAGDAIVSFDEDRRIITWNPAAEKIFGRSEQDAIGANFFETLIVEEFYTALDRRIRRADSFSVDGAIEIEAKRNGLSTFPAAVTCSSRMTDYGWVATCIIRDITERKEFEDGVRALNEELTRKVMDLSVALETVRAQNDLLQAVQRAQTRFIFADEPDTVFGALLGDLLSLTNSEFGFIGEVMYTDEGRMFLRECAISNVAWDEPSRAAHAKFAEEKELDFPEIRGLWSAALTTGKPVISNEPGDDLRKGGTPEGHPTLHAFVGIPFHSEGELLGMAGLANRPGGYDEEMVEFLEPYSATTAIIIRAYRIEKERRLAEQQLADAHARLEQTVLERTAELRTANEKLQELVRELRSKNEDLERFAYTISHDLKSPLLTINSFTGMIKRDITSGDIDRALSDLDRISRAVNHMSRLMSGILQVSRVGRLVNAPEEVSFADIAREAEELSRNVLDEKGVSVELRNEKSFPRVVVDRPRIVEVMTNLLDNSVKYMGDQPDPRIEIGVRNDFDDPVFSVRDNGIGIEPRFHSLIFDLFEQMNPAAQGTGLGLHLCKRIIEHHGGKIWVESDGPGHGSTFCFTLPGAAPDSPATERVTPEDRTT